MIPGNINTFGPRGGGAFFAAAASTDNCA